MTKHEWNVAFIRALLNYSMAIWKYRCEYMHKANIGSMDLQVRELAQKLRNKMLKKSIEIEK